MSSERHKLRIAFVIFSLRRGGAERVVVLLANFFASLGHDVDIILTGASKCEAPAYSVEPAVNIRSLADYFQESSSFFCRAIAAFLRVTRLRSLIRFGRYDAMIAFTREVNLTMLVATMGIRVKKIISERNHPIRFSSQSLVRRLAVRMLYPMADWLVVQTTQIAFCYRWHHHVAVIPNPVLHAVLPSEANAGNLSPRIVAAGRLVPQKGFDRLLEAVSILRKNGLTPELVVFGEGSDREKLVELADSLGLGRGVFYGVVPHFAAALRVSDIFVLSSRFEGFPNVLVEAMSCGIPPVAFDCPSGPAEIISNGENGLLVPEGDVSAMAAGIQRLLLNPEFARKMGERARQTTARYCLPDVSSMWMRVLH